MKTIQIHITGIDNAVALKRSVGQTITLDLEAQYLCGAVAAEIGGEIRTREAIAAAEAQAIAMRTNALRYQQKGLPVSDQSGSFQAFDARLMAAAAYALCHEAVQATAGMVLYYQGKLVNAPSFSHNNGGRTTSALTRWPGGGGRPWLIEQDDPWDAAVGGPKKGHGVGMSQLGAVYAAKELHKSTLEILQFYYPGTEVRTAYGEGGAVIDAGSGNGTGESVSAPVADVAAEEAAGNDGADSGSAEPVSETVAADALDVLIAIQDKNLCYIERKPSHPVGILVHSTGAVNRELRRYVDAVEQLGKNQYDKQ